MTNGNEDILDRLVGSQRRAIHYYVWFTVAIVTIGLSISGFGLLFADRFKVDGLKWILGLGGGFMSTLSGVPIKEVVSRKEKIDMFQCFQEHLNVLQKVPDSNEQKRIEDILWQAVSRAATGS